MHIIREAQSPHHVTHERKRSDDVRLAMEGRVRRITWAHVVYPTYGIVEWVRERRASGCLAAEFLSEVAYASGTAGLLLRFTGAARKGRYTIGEFS